MSEANSGLNSPTLSLAGTVAPPNMDGVMELMDVLKRTMEQLGGTFETLGQTTQAVEQLQTEPALDSVQQISALRKHLVMQDRRQAAKMEEIKRLLKDVLQEEIVEHLKGQIADQIQSIIDAEVEAQVQAQLATHIPSTLQQTVANNQQQLHDVQYSLHNAEARRANALLRSNHLLGTVHALYKRDGTVSEFFPKDLTNLLTMDGDTASKLLTDYGIVPSDSREKNLNKFMNFANVGYQVVPFDMATAITA